MIGEKVIVIIDSEHYWDIPNNNYDSIYLNKNSMDNIMPSYESGIYEMEILETEDFEGQKGEYGSWECEPYNAITKVKMTLIGEIKSWWMNPSHKKALEVESLSEELNQFVKYVNAQSQNDIYYTIYPSWNSTIVFGTKTTPESWMYTPLKTYPNKMTRENVDAIITSVKGYLKEGYFAEDTPEQPMEEALLENESSFTDEGDASPCITPL